MRKWITLCEDIWPDWQLWLFRHPNAVSLLDNSEELMARLPEPYHYNASKVLMHLSSWRNGDRKVYRVLGISDHDGKFGGDARAAARAFAKRLQDDPSTHVGCYWSRSYSGDPHTRLGGASMGYDVDAEGFPVVLAATVKPDCVVWGATIAANIAYPPEEEVTIEGTVMMRYTAVDDEYVDFTGARQTGPYVA